MCSLLVFTLNLIVSMKHNIYCRENCPSMCLLCCGSAYHLSCLLQWIKRGGTTCPICRNSFVTKHAQYQNGSIRSSTTITVQVQSETELHLEVYPPSTSFRNSDQNSATESIQRIVPVLRTPPTSNDVIPLAPLPEGIIIA